MIIKLEDSVGCVKSTCLQAGTGCVTTFDRSCEAAKCGLVACARQRATCRLKRYLHDIKCNLLIFTDIKLILVEICLLDSSNAVRWMTLSAVTAAAEAPGMASLARRCRGAGCHCQQCQCCRALPGHDRAAPHASQQKGALHRPPPAPAPRHRGAACSTTRANPGACWGQSSWQGCRGRRVWGQGWQGGAPRGSW